MHLSKFTNPFFVQLDPKHSQTVTTRTNQSFRQEAKLHALQSMQTDTETRRTQQLRDRVVCLDPAAPSARRVKGEDGRKTTSNYMSDSDLDI